MTLAEKRERAAYLVKESKRLLTENPGEVPKDIADQIEGYMAEFEGLVKELQAVSVQDGLRAKVATAYGDFHEAPIARTGIGAPTLEGAGGFAHFGKYLKAIYVASVGGRRDRRLAIPSAMVGWDTKDLEEGTGSAGGFLVPTQFEATLLQVAGEGAIVYPRATKIPMERRQVNIPALDYEVGAGDGKSAFFGGVRAYWTEESASKPETEPKFRQVQLVAHKLAGHTKVEDELLEDSAISLASLLTTLFGGAIRWQEDFVFLAGDGVGKPLGVLNAPATIVVPRAIAGAVTYIDIVNMLTQLLPGANPIWVMGTTVLPQLLTMTDPNGNYIYHPAFGIAGAAGAMPATLMGYPVIRTEKLPALGVAGDILLADFSYYLIGDRKGITIAYSTEYLFPYDETVWRFLRRVDGQPWLNAPIPMQDGNTVSPFLILGLISQGT